ncbi:MAG: hypothetical protein IT284_02315 [Bacteroidetes bacterium]|nr:hypothetical protein [Bacteroidota bacterium]
MFWRKKNKLNRVTLDFDEILMDSRNIPSFDVQQFEGRIEQSISKRTLWLVGLVFGLVMIIFVGRLRILQIKEGNQYFIRSEDNSLNSQIIFADRGVIFDRNNVELAWNERTEDMTDFDFSKRVYITSPGHNLLLGYIKYPQKDKAGNFWQTYYEGLDGVEKAYNDYLNGDNGSRIIEVDVHGEVSSENIVNPPVHGLNLNLTIDSRLQSKMYEAIQNLSNDIGYLGGAGIMMDIKTGELLAITSYPEYGSKILSDGEDSTLIQEFTQNPNKPFLNRAVGGLYSPGSTVKPFIALGALNEGIINENTHITSVGQIEVPSPYDENVVAIFRDWKKGGHGSTDVTKALAESVNTFFYAIGGGYRGQTGLGISRIEKYIKMFGIGNKTDIDILGEIAGVVPNPDWKKKTFNGDAWRLGDTYNTSIGQYGFQVTPVQMIRAVSAIANGGQLLTPHVILEKPTEARIIPTEFSTEDFDLIKSGMRKVVTEGTGQVLNVSYIDIAGKTGSAQTGLQNKFINSWVVGFFPYEDPKYAFVFLMEKGPSTAERSASFAAREFFDWMKNNTPEYLGLPPKTPENPELTEGQ